MSKTVNLKGFAYIELLDLSSDDMHPKLKFYGASPGGKNLAIIVDLPAWGIGHLADILREALKKQEQFVAENRASLEGRTK